MRDESPWSQGRGKAMSNWGQEGERESSFKYSKTLP